MLYRVLPDGLSLTDEEHPLEYSTVTADRLFLSPDSLLGDAVPHTHSTYTFPTPFLSPGSPSPSYGEVEGLQAITSPDLIYQVFPQDMSQMYSQTCMRKQGRGQVPLCLFSFICAQPCAQTPGNWDHCMTGTATCLIRVNKIIDDFAHTRGAASDIFPRRRGECAPSSCIRRSQMRQ